MPSSSAGGVAAASSRAAVNAADTPRSRALWLLACLLVALVARLVALADFEPARELQGDETYYVRQALSIARGEGHPGSIRPPLYPAFLAATLTVYGDYLEAQRGTKMVALRRGALDALRYVQIGVSLLAVLAVFRIAGARFGATAAGISGMTCALIPSLAHYPHFLWSECLTATLVILFFWALDVFDRSERLLALALSGILLGLAALSRETWVYFGGLVVLWVLWRSRWKWREACAPTFAFLACLALVVGPWTVRNWRVHERFVPVSSNRWFPIAAGNLLPEDKWFLGPTEPRRQGRKAELRGLDEIEEDAYWRGVALQAIASEQPWWVFKKLTRNTAELFALRSQPIRYLELGWYPDPTPWFVRRTVAGEVLGHLLAMLLGIVALWLVPGGRLKVLVVAAIVFTWAVHVVANAVPRFNVPLMPLFALYVGPLIVGVLRRGRPLGTPTGRPTRRRLVAAAVCVLVFLVLVFARWGVDVAPTLRLASSP